MAGHRVVARTAGRGSPLWAIALGATLILVGFLGIQPHAAGPDARPTGPTPSAVRPLAAPPPTASQATPPASQIATARPAAGPSLTVSGLSPSMVSLSWTATTDFTASNYAVAESTQGPTGPWTTVGNVTTQSATEFGVSSLSPDGSYWWQVTPNGLFSTASNVANSTQPPVANLTYTPPTSSSAQFNWTNNATDGGLLSFVAYDLFESVNGTSPTLVAGISTVSVRSFTVTGLTSGAGYSFYLTTVDCLGCGTASPVEAGTASNTVTFGTPLPLGASTSAARAALDVGQPDLFTCHPSGGTSPYTFRWDYGNGTRLPGAGSVSHTFATAGTATVTCYVTDATAQVASAGTNVQANVPPQVRVQANLTRADAGQTIGFQCLSSNGTAPYEPLYTWSFGDGTAAQAAVPTTSHVFASSGTFSPSCVATDAAAATASGSIVMTIQQALDVHVLVDSSRAAPGFLLNFSAVATNGSGSYSTFAWSFGPGGGTASGPDVRHAFALPASGATAQVAVTDTNGQTVRATVSLNVSPIVVVLASPPSTAVSGHDVAFSATASGGGGGPYTFRWSFGDGTTGTGASVEHSYGSSQVFQPTLVVTDRLGANNSTTLGAVSVSAPPPLVPTWIVGVLALVVVAIVLLLLVFRRRRRASERLRSEAPWAPPTAPKRSILGAKVCPSCGASNVPLRTTCEVCGTDLPSRARGG